jgi:predicted component of type VI protein secretion system
LQAVLLWVLKKFLLKTVPGNVFKLAIDLAIKKLGSISPEEMAEYRDQLIALIKALSEKFEASPTSRVTSRSVVDESTQGGEYVYFIIK